MMSSYLTITFTNLADTYTLLTVSSLIQAMFEFAGYSETRNKGKENGKRNYIGEVMNIINMGIAFTVFFWSLVVVNPINEPEFTFECLPPEDYADPTERELGIINPNLEVAEDPEIRQAREQQEYE